MPLVSLEDCDLRMVSYRNDLNQDAHRLDLTLPKLIDLTGIKPFIPKYSVWHEQYVGTSGVLYVACDWFARFWPREYLERGARGHDYNIGNFVSYGHDGDRRIFQRFRLKEADQFLFGISPEDQKQAIIDTINRHPTLSVFLQRFFEWLNEFIQIHGEARYLDQETYWRNLFAKSPDA